MRNMAAGSPVRAAFCAAMVSAAAAQLPAALDGLSFNGTLATRPVAAVAFFDSFGASLMLEAEWDAAAEVLAREQQAEGDDDAVELFSVDCDEDASVCEQAVPGRIPAIMLFREGKVAKAEYPHQHTAAVIASWLRKEAAPPVRRVTGVEGLSAAVDTAAESGRAVAALLSLDGGVSEDEVAAGTLGKLAAARLQRHDFVDFVAVAGAGLATDEAAEEKDTSAAGSGSSSGRSSGSVVMLAECAGQEEVSACLRATRRGSSKQLPACCLGAMEPGEAAGLNGRRDAASELLAMRDLSDWVYDSDVPLFGQINERNAARYLNKEPKKLGVMYLPIDSSCAQQEQEQEQEHADGDDDDWEEEDEDEFGGGGSQDRNDDVVYSCESDAWQDSIEAAVGFETAMLAAAAIGSSYKVVDDPFRDTMLFRGGGGGGGGADYSGDDAVEEPQEQQQDEEQEATEEEEEEEPLRQVVTSRPMRDLILVWTSLDQYPDEDAAAAGGSARFDVVDYTEWGRSVYPGTIGRGSSSSSSSGDSSDGDSSDGGGTTSGDSDSSDDSDDSDDSAAAAAADANEIAAFVKVRAMLCCAV